MRELVLSDAVREAGLHPQPIVEALQDVKHAVCDWLAFTYPELKAWWVSKCEAGWYDEIITFVACLLAYVYARNLIDPFYGCKNDSESLSRCVPLFIICCSQQAIKCAVRQIQEQSRNG